MTNVTDNRTTELRKLLDERSVEYESDDRKTYAYTYWGDWAYCEPLDAKPGTLGAQCELMLIPSTPEQAIAATLGEREREIEEHEPDGWHECPECGCVVGYWLLNDGSWTIYMDDYQIPYNNCPECGAKVKEVR